MSHEVAWGDTKVYVAGHNGLVGSAIVRALEAAGAGEIIGWSSKELDLRDREATFDAITEAKPDIIIDAAAKVGGIMANSTFPVEFLRDNALIQTNVMDAAHSIDVDRLLFLGSSCIYPRHATQPIRESSLMTGPLEPTNQAYAMAKISGIYYIEAHRTQYGRHWISAMPTNLYGPRDNFDLQSSHVLPAFIRRFHEAKESGAASVTVELRLRADHQRRLRRGSPHQGTRRDRGRCRRLHRHHRVGLVEARRHAAQAARHLAHQRPRLEAADLAARRTHLDLRVVPRERGLSRWPAVPRWRPMSPVSSSSPAASRP